MQSAQSSNDKDGDNDFKFEPPRTESNKITKNTPKLN